MRGVTVDSVCKAEAKVVMGCWVGVGMVIPISYQTHGRDLALRWESLDLPVANKVANEVQSP